ncbi:unnamed protein product, partial [Iphiclides podalirius]
MELARSILLTLLLSCAVYDAVQLDLSPAQQRIVDDLSWATRSRVLTEKADTRRVGIQPLVDGRRQGERPLGPTPPFADDEIKLKLFRMMYESISDSDSKIKRADTIRRSYENSTSFEVGFIVADATDKFDTMVDISSMLERLFADWRPIEHINAYEHIANKGIEISQLIELAKSVAKRNATLTGYRRALVNISLW